jgi:hypothetical protein
MGDHAEAVQVDSTPVDVGSDFQEKSHVASFFEPPGWDWNADTNWFVSNFCTPRPGLKLCRTRVSSASHKGPVSRRRTTTGLNQGFLINGNVTLDVLRDPCEGSPPWNFCTTPFIHFGIVNLEARHFATFTQFDSTLSWTSRISGGPNALVALSVASL